MSALPSPTALGHFEQGLRAYEANQFGAAETLLRQALNHDASNVEAMHVFALVLNATGRKDDALRLLKDVVATQPNDGGAWSNIGAILREFGQLSEAVLALERAIESEPRNAPALNNLGTVYFDLAEAAKAETYFTRALEIDPRYAAALSNMSRCAFQKGSIKESGQFARSAIALDPNLGEAYNRQSFVLAAIGDVDGCLKSTAKSIELDPENDLNQSNWLLRAQSSSSVTGAEITAKARLWGSKYETVEPQFHVPFRSIKRIGFVSGDFHNHPVGRFFRSLAHELNNNVELVCYSANNAEDETTRTIKAECAEWRCIYRQPGESVASHIADDKIDVLIDLAGHTGNNRLDVFAHKPAPKQITWLGYPGSTGLIQMDGLIADWNLIPENHEDRYSERVLRLSGTFLSSDEYADKVERKVPNRTVFGVFNNPSKFSRKAFELWASALKSVPGSEILFKYHLSNDSYVQRSIVTRLGEFGVTPGQVQFAPFMSHKEHLELVASVTVALDTFPYSGATTTLDCLACGTPVVTLVGDRYSSRMSASLLRQTGGDRYVAEAEDAYLETVLSTVEDENSSASADRFDLSAICDAKSFADGFLATISTL